VKQRAIPRGIVICLCAIPWLVPAIAATGAFNSSNYVLSGTNINHRDTDDYKVYADAYSGYPGLQDKILDARSEWNDDLSGSPVDVPRTMTESAAQIKFGKVAGDSNTKVIITGNYHSPGTAKFNTYGSIINNMSASQRRAQACRAIGTLMGIKQTSTATDCMNSASNITTNTVGAATIQKVDDFYGLHATFSGDLYDERDDIDQSDASLNISASGHDLTSMTVYLDYLNGASSWSGTLDAAVTTCTTSYDRCTLNASHPHMDLSWLPGGRYRVRAVMTNAYGTPGTESFEFAVDPPYFGYDDTWGFSDWYENTGAYPKVTTAINGGADTVRVVVNMNDVYSQGADPSCSGAPQWDWSHYEDIYDNLIAQGVKPVLQAFGADRCVAATRNTSGSPPNYGYGVPSGDGCTPVYYDPPQTFGDGERLLATNSTAEAAWREFIKQMADHSPSARAIEVWNEPNAAQFWGGCEPSANRYEQLLEYAHDGVSESTHPTIPVLFAGLQYVDDNTVGAGDPGAGTYKRRNWSTFVSTAMFNGALSDMEGMGLHPYLQKGNCSQTYGESADEQFDAMRAIIGTTTPIWVTEIGVAMSDGNNGSDSSDCRGAIHAGDTAAQSEDRQADGVTSMYDMVADRSNAFLVYQLVDQVNVPDPWESSLGVAGTTGTSDHRPHAIDLRQSYCDLAALRGATPNCN
jgi:hypothetical protein